MSWTALYWMSVVLLLIMLTLMVIAFASGLWLTGVANMGAAVAFMGLILVAKANLSRPSS